MFVFLQVPVEAVEGEEVLMDVPLRGHPSPVIEWSIDGKPLEVTNNNEVSQDIVFGKLKINKVTPGDSGVYKCVVSSAKGSTTKKFLLNVESMYKCVSCSNSVCILNYIFC
jgi:hypothetical protein